LLKLLGEIDPRSLPPGRLVDQVLGAGLAVGPGDADHLRAHLVADVGGQLAHGGAGVGDLDERDVGRGVVGDVLHEGGDRATGGGVGEEAVTVEVIALERMKSEDLSIRRVSVQTASTGRPVG